MNAYRTAIRSRWKGRCNVITREPVTDPITKITDFKEVVICKDQPCHLSITNAPIVGEGSVAGTTQTVKLFIDESLTIPPGSKIIITQNGVTGDYERSGIPGTYSHHQEIALQKFNGWA